MAALPISASVAIPITIVLLSLVVAAVLTMAFQEMALMQQAHLEPKHFQLVYPEENKPANLVLIEAVKDAKPMLHPMEPLIIYTKEHDLTIRLKSVYNIQEQNKV